MLKTVLLVIETISALLLVAVILLQTKGTGLGSSFGGGGEFYSSRRGIEKTIVYATIVLIVIFGATSIGLLLLG